MKMDNLGARQMRSNNYSAHACEHCSNPLIVGLCRVYVSKQLFVVSICYCCLNSNVNTKLTNRDISFRFSFLFGLHFSSSVSTRCYPICAISSSFICFGDRYSLMCELIWVCCATATADSFHFLRRHLHHSCIAMALWLRLAGIPLEWQAMSHNYMFIWEAEQWEFRCCSFSFNKPIPSGM